VARAGGKSYLMLPLAFPIVLPILIFAAKGTAMAMTGNGGNQAIGLVSYQVAMITLSAMLFEKVWTDA
jgi:ABC-type transport system involved in cytochrome c biogenesis permease component